MLHGLLLYRLLHLLSRLLTPGLVCLDWLLLDILRLSPTLVYRLLAPLVWHLVRLLRHNLGPDLRLLELLLVPLVSWLLLLWLTPVTLRGNYVLRSCGVLHVCTDHFWLLLSLCINNWHRLADGLLLHLLDTNWLLIRHLVLRNHVHLVDLTKLAYRLLRIHLHLDWLLLLLHRASCKHCFSGGRSH